MEKLKEALIQFAHSNPSLFSNDANISYPVLIEQCFPQFFSDFQTPNHPPYAAMIYKAIWKLNKKGGSSEKSISKYIKKEYADLPWAHSTLLKHHLEKLCDRKEICMTNKQCYLLAGAESESGKKSSGPGKKQTSQSGPETGKKSGRPHKKYKKNAKSRSGIQETSDREQIGLHKRKRKQRLKTIRKSSKRAKKHTINEDTKLQLLDEANLKQNDEVTDGESHEQDQALEVNMVDIQIQEENEMGQESDHDYSGYINFEETQTAKSPELVQPEESPDSNPMLHGNDIQIQEQNEMGQESDHDPSGYINLEEIQAKKNPELLQPEESPDSNPMLHGNGKRVWTRSQIKTVSKKDALAASSESIDSLGDANMAKDKPDIVEHSSNENRQAVEIVNVKITVDTEPQEMSRSPSLDKPLIEFLKSMSSKLVPRVPDDEPTTGPSSTVQDPIGPQQDQQPDKSPVEDKPKRKRRGRPQKPTEPEKDEVLCNPKPAAISRKSQKSTKKGKVGNKKGQPKYKVHGSRHKMTRRSSRNRSS